MEILMVIGIIKPFSLFSVKTIAIIQYSASFEKMATSRIYFCKGPLLQYLRKKVISLRIEKANTIGNKYNDKEYFI